ncbi:MAG TPA: NADH-quinone oxidoreductase subunit N [Thermoanaerobaculia bacterium]|nr:NADH-quinone oxidoreductase subunit N [Thermoanaerobaculia bacterium]
MTVRPHDWLLLSPELVLSAVASLILCLAVFTSKAREKALAILAIAGVAATALLLLVLWRDPSRSAPILSGMFVLDNFAIFFKLLVLLTCALTVLSSVRFVGDAAYPAGEYYGLVLFATVGTMFMASGDSLASIYVSLELMALSSYVLAGYFKEQVKSTEAATKYFILGAFSSGVLLYGISLLYGFSGKMGLADLAAAFPTIPANRILSIGVLLLLFGILFKIAAVPFHVWAPDVYEGAPTPITAFLSVGPKAGAYAILARIFYVALPHFAADWKLAVAISAAATLVVGNVAALLQTNVKRLLAYSSIANAGYALLGVLGFEQGGIAAIEIYLLTYTFMNFGAFALVIFLESKGYAGESIDDWKGLARRNPLLSAVMLIFLLSLAGIPTTGGFIGKYYLFAVAVHAGYGGLAVLAVLASAVSLFYYFRIVMAMYLTDGEAAPLKSSPGVAWSAAVCAVMTMVIGLAPQPFIALISRCGL